MIASTEAGSGWHRLLLLPALRAASIQFFGSAAENRNEQIVFLAKVIACQCDIDTGAAISRKVTPSNPLAAKQGLCGIQNSVAGLLGRRCYCCHCLILLLMALVSPSLPLIDSVFQQLLKFSSRLVYSVSNR